MYRDTRLGNVEKWYHTVPKDAYMRIPDELIKSVCFISVKLPDGDGKFLMTTLGTGFFVELTEGDYSCRYLITAKHVLDDAKRINVDTVFLRVNVKNGRYKYLDVKLNDLWFKWGNDAIDFVALSLKIDWKDLDQKCLPLESFATNEVISREWVGLGDDVFVVGLFRFRKGKERNLRILRTGIISAMPDEPIPYKNKGVFDAYLVELRSIGGLSGSPVFLYLDKKNRPVPTTENAIYLLGIIRGHWNLKSETDEVENDVSLGFSKGENLNVGIAMVTPAQEVFELLMTPEHVDMRKKWIDKYEDKNSFVEDGVTNVIDGDLFTKEVFLNDLKKATQRISPSDQETKET